MTELRKKVLDEINSLYKHVDDTNLQNNLKILYDYVEDKNNLKADQDIRIFLYTNRDHAAIKPYSSINDDNYKAINEIITGKEPNLIKEDIKLKDIFGETYAEPGVLDDMKGKHLKNLTDAKKVNLYDALKVAEDEAVKKAREDIYRPWNTVQQIFTPRLYERRMRGETPDNFFDVDYKDLGLDVIENAAYTFLPGSILKYISKIPQAIPTVLAKGANALINAGAKGAKSDKVAKAANIANTAIDKGAKGINKGISKLIDNPPTNFVAGAVTNPFMMEGLDALTYDDNESTDRKDFSLTDALIGSGINVGAPIAFRTPVGIVGRLLGGAKRGPKISKVINQMGEGKSISDLRRESYVAKDAFFADDAARKVYDEKYLANVNPDEKYEFYKYLKDKARNKEYDPRLLAHLDEVAYDLQPLAKDMENNVFQAIWADMNKGNYGKSIPEKTVDAIKNIPKAFVNNVKKKPRLISSLREQAKQKTELVDKVLAKNKRFDKFDIDEKLKVRDELLDILEDVKFDSDKAAEGYLLSYVTNKYGDMAYGDKASSLPIVGEGIKWLNERELAKKRQKVRDSFAKMLLPEYKPDATKESK